VCRECWDCISSFEEFHQRVSGLHQQRSSDSKSVPIEFFGQTEEVINPLYSVELDALAEGFFAPSWASVGGNS